MTPVSPRHMRGAYLPGNSTVDLRTVPVPSPGKGQVLVRVEASTICGSDIRAIYREHTGSGAEAYQDVIAGHEPSGVVEEVGPEVKERTSGDRVVVYHISGCGLCQECRAGYQIACTSPLRQAYGWQRDGGHAQYLLAEERDLVLLPDSLTFLDGACVACGFGTAYEAVRRADVSGADSILVTGLGPVGLAVGMLARALGASTVIGSDPVANRRSEAVDMGAVTSAIDPTVGAVPENQFSVAIDASGNGRGQLAALHGLRRWGRGVLVGEGGSFPIEGSPDLIHKSAALMGSWVTSLPRMQELARNLDRWGLHPEKVVTHSYPLAEADAAYEAAAGGAEGKIAILPNA
jgi:threonine dehydrogenase-like Zn-dependent dehydrogenase